MTDSAKTHIVFYSGGGASWLSARIIRDENPDGKLVLLFADTRMEDEDTYRFLEDGAKQIGVPVTRIADGRNIWQVFEDERFLGNSRVDPCSRVLKRNLLNKWVDDRYGPDECVLVIGLDAFEEHRLKRFVERRAPYEVDAPLIRHGITKEVVHERVKAAGLIQQRMYKMGFPHANCGGGCVKAGRSHFLLLLEKFPERYREWEKNETRLRTMLGDVTILRETVEGKRQNLTLRALRERHESRPSLFAKEEQDWGGCGCAVD